jgi:hypothetical protein
MLPQFFVPAAVLQEPKVTIIALGSVLKLLKPSDANAEL